MNAPCVLMSSKTLFIGKPKEHNNRVNSDCKKLHSEAAQLFASGYAER